MTKSENISNSFRTSSEDHRPTGWRVFPVAAYTVYILFTVRIVLLGNLTPTSLSYGVEDLNAYTGLRVGVFALMGIYWLVPWMVGDYPRMTIFKGPVVWTVLFLVLGALSWGWSVSRMYSIYRICELTAALGFTTFLIDQTRGKANIYTLVRFVTIPVIIAALAVGVLGLRPAVAGGILGQLKNNGACAISGILMLSEFNLCLSADSPEHRRRGAILAALAAILVILFGSAAVLATIYTTVILLAFLYRAKYPTMFLALCVAPIAAGLVALTIYKITSIDLLSLILAKERRYVGSLTGRIWLWGELLEIWRRRPNLGFGFGTMRFLMPERASSWLMGHAHSGYIAALVGLGIAGSSALLMAFASGFWNAFHLERAERNLTIALLVFLAMVNITQTAIGGMYHPLWLIWCALAYWITVRKEEDLRV